jgi:hypothetical protein
MAPPLDMTPEQVEEQRRQMDKNFKETGSAFRFPDVEIDAGHP